MRHFMTRNEVQFHIIFGPNNTNLEKKVKAFEQIWLKKLKSKYGPYYISFGSSTMMTEVIQWEHDIVLT